ncbi:hypothetical protein L1987_30938 [Smallanthus sonchifolius]|uniref:Uncharacterized protein n=1 Tax=Smallanthus sonchifolius TaxID=185202 RepID=A0ACB9I5M1_9ASTR|nr:hypothetical protein L1987_30938 [Smallanthus sonchifolius]
MPMLILFLLLTSLNLNHGRSNIITSSCITTLYPDICYSTVSEDVTQKLLTKKDVIEHTINKTKDTIEANLHTITTLTTASNNLTQRARMALHECLDMEAATLEQLDTVIHTLREYPTKKSLSQYADDLKTLMSATITNKETCLDALSYYDNDDANKWLHMKSIVKGQEHGGKMCSNVLAMIKSMTDTDIYNPADQGNKVAGRKLKEIMWPEWLSAGDRKLLGLFGVTPNVIVAKDGKGNYTTVAEAVDAAPNKSKKRYVIKITAGTYKEHIQIPRNKHNIMFVGEGRGKTIITGNKNVAGGHTTTSSSATVAALGERFLARDITFQNTAGPSGHQAVALRVAADLSAFYKCGMEGYQDTLYVHSNRQFYVKCFVTGTVDFIFGNAAVVFQFCDIMARKPNPNQLNMITAQGRTDVNQDTGIVIQKCNIGASRDLKAVQGNFPTYLGRPWKKFSRTVVMESIMSDVIRKEGWHPWDGTDFALDSLYYREYRNIGPGSDTSKRVTWKGWGVIKDRNEARNFTVSRFINGWTWLLSTGFPFWSGL